jgi:hypothetical protein
MNAIYTMAKNDIKESAEEYTEAYKAGLDHRVDITRTEEKWFPCRNEQKTQCHQKKAEIKDGLFVYF